MRKKEQLLWDSLKRNMPEELWLQRVENLFGDGMPDVFVGRSGKWVELKAPPRIPARAATPLLGESFGLRQSQVNWHTKYAGSLAPESYILIRTPDHELLLIPGCCAPVVNACSLESCRELNLLHGATGAEAWARLTQELK